LAGFKSGDSVSGALEEEIRAVDAQTAAAGRCSLVGHSRSSFVELTAMTTEGKFLR